MATHSYENIYLQIVPVKVKATEGENFENFSLLDSGSQSTLIREYFANKLKLNGTKGSITLSTVKERREPIKVKEFFLTILDDEQENALHISIYHTKKYV